MLSNSLQSSKPTCCLSLFSCTLSLFLTCWTKLCTDIKKQNKTAILWWRLQKVDRILQDPSLCRHKMNRMEISCLTQDSGLCNSSCEDGISTLAIFTAFFLVVTVKNSHHNSCEGTLDTTILNCTDFIVNFTNYAVGSVSRTMQDCVKYYSALCFNFLACENV